MLILGHFNFQDRSLLVELLDSKLILGPRELQQLQVRGYNRVTLLEESFRRLMARVLQRALCSCW